MKANLVDLSPISGVKLGIELLDSNLLESENAWGFVLDLLILRVSYYHNINVDE